MIIDGDGHYVEPAALWADWVAPRCGAGVEVRRGAAGELLRVVLGDLVAFDSGEYSDTVQPFGPGDAFNPGGLRRENVRNRRLEESDPGGWEPVAGLRMHDEEGIDAAVLFPSMAPIAGNIGDPRIAAGVCQGINDWLADFAWRRPTSCVEVLGWMNEHPLRRSATETFREQCIIGCEGEERMVPYVQELLGEQAVIWASDYPHFDISRPCTRDMRERDDMSDAQRQGVMCGAALRFYCLDAERIAGSNAARRGTAVPEAAR